jgi:hypothetical protein
LNVDIKVNTAKVGPISESLFSFGHTQDNIIGKATFKIENDFNGQTKNPSTEEFYLEKYGFKLGKQDLAFGMPRSNFNILDVGTRHVRSFGGTGLSYALSSNGFDYNVYLTSYKKGADVKRLFDFNGGSVVAGLYSEVDPTLAVLTLISTLKSTALIAIDNKTNIIINIFFMIAPRNQVIV